jgi:hypothetical protein
LCGRAATGEAELEEPRGLALETGGEPNLGGVPAEDALGGLAEEQLAGLVGEPELAFAVEGKNRDIDLLHHSAEERGGLERAEPLILEGAAEGVDLGQDFAERLIAPGAAGADGEVALAQRGEQVGHRLQRADDVILEGEREAQPASDCHQREGPLFLRLHAAAPHIVLRHGDRGQSGQQHVQQHELLMG